MSLCQVIDVAECSHFLVLLLVCFSNPCTLLKLLFFESESFPQLLIICGVFTYPSSPNVEHLQPYFLFVGHLCITGFLGTCIPNHLLMLVTCITIRFFICDKMFFTRLGSPSFTPRNIFWH